MCVTCKFMFFLPASFGNRVDFVLHAARRVLSERVKRVDSQSGGFGVFEGRPGSPVS